MAKRELARAIADELGITAQAALRAVRMALDGITDVLVKEGRVELRNFGVFEVKKRKARKARNPRTGAHVKVPAKLVVSFKPGLEMQQRVGQLKKVMVCAPGRAHQRLTPSNCDALLFDDVLWVDNAKRDHFDFMTKMRDRGIEVVEMPTSELVAMLDAGTIEDMKILALAQALRLRHPDLFA